MGRIGHDPELLEVQSGQKRTRFGVATSRKVKHGEDVTDETTWHRVCVWGNLADLCHQYLRKGSPVYIEGRLRSYQFTGKDGQDRAGMEIQAEEVIFLESKADTERRNRA